MVRRDQWGRRTMVAWRIRAGACLVALAASASPATSFEPFAPLAPPPSAGETLTVEPFLGYLRGTSGETVYDLRDPRAKVSQLDWAVNALAVGGRVAMRPVDGLTVRGRAWATVASSGEMTDYDWFGGYFGRDSWTHRSHHPATDLGKAWQGDVSAALTLYGDGELALTAIGGYRHYDVKYAARGGSYVYSGAGFRDTLGTFTPGRLGIAYEQWWDTPYFGIGAAYNGVDWSVTGELIGSPFVFGRDKDHHALRNLVFREKLEMSGMIGFALGTEYRFTPNISLVGRAEYQKYLHAKGGTRLDDATTGQTTYYPKPAAGADAETLLLSLGVKARL